MKESRTVVAWGWRVRVRKQSGLHIYPTTIAASERGENRQLEVRLGRAFQQGQAFPQPGAEVCLGALGPVKLPLAPWPHLTTHPGPQAKGCGRLALKIVETYFNPITSMYLFYSADNTDRDKFRFTI